MERGTFEDIAGVGLLWIVFAGLTCMLPPFWLVFWTPIVIKALAERDWEAVGIFGTLWLVAALGTYVLFFQRQWLEGLQ